MKQALLRTPLLHFLLLGGVLYGAQLWPGFKRAPAIALSSAQQKLADERILLREAQRLGLNQSDSVVQGRLLQNLRFAYPDAKASDAVLLKQALALGMDERDLVTRRRLIQLMEQRLSTDTKITDADLRRFVAAHPERYAQPARIAFKQVFVDTDRHAGRLDEAAADLRARLQQPTAAALGDPFLGGSQFASSSEPEIAKVFGEPFAQAAMRATPQSWVGPIRSPYGLHFVWVEATSAAGEADFESLRRRIYYAVLEQHEHASVQAAMQRLRQRYPQEIAAVLARP